MFSDMIRTLPCEICEEGEMHYSQKDTFDAWTKPDVFRLDDIDKIVDGILSDVLVFFCDKCGATMRYTMKEIEKKFRKKLSDRIMTMIAMSDIPDPGAMETGPRIMIYCGKCGGCDGKGSCTRAVYDNCRLKRLV